MGKLADILRQSPRAAKRDNARERTKAQKDFTQHCEQEEEKHKAREATAIVAKALGVHGEDIIEPEDLKEALRQQARRQQAELELLVKETPVRELSGDKIVYTLQSTLAKDEGRIVAASFEKDPCTQIGLTELVPLVVNMEEARAKALAKLDGLDRLVLGLD